MCKFPRFTMFLVGCLGAWLAMGSRLEAANSKRPDVLVILADDLGFSDLGCYGGEIRTPNLDGLAQGGLRFTHFYNTARCWPSRSSLLTGYYAQHIRRDTLDAIPRSGGRGIRPEWAPLLPELLKASGYRSFHSGKWHVDGTDLQGGFDRGYDLADHGRYFSPKRQTLDDKPLPQPQPGSGFYTTREVANRALEFLTEHVEKHGDEPFFGYVAFTAPHFPLQAEAEDIARYSGVYESGWDEIRKRRWERMKSLGIVNCELPPMEEEVGPPYHFPKALAAFGPLEISQPAPWRKLTAEQQKFQAAKMSVHAAMVDRMDHEIGRILAYLREKNRLENTLILFLSDNGASAEMMVRDDGHDATAAPGSAGTHLCLGPAWSSVANTPLRRHKTWVHEGGISTPFIVHWPARIRSGGEMRTTPSHLVDVVPSILEATATPAIAEWKGMKRPEAPGRSLLSVLDKNESIERPFLWWSHEGNLALREKDWKIVKARKGDWELYDLATDRGERVNLAAKKPELVERLARLWSQTEAGFVRDLKDLPHPIGSKGGRHD